MEQRGNRASERASDVETEGKASVGVTREMPTELAVKVDECDDDRATAVTAKRLVQDKRLRR